jgi:2C-methyl-D-erythritol 2,4-cyclodiphosphate synthase
MQSLDPVSFEVFNIKIFLIYFKNKIFYKDSRIKNIESKLVEIKTFLVNLKAKFGVNNNINNFSSPSNKTISVTNL